MIFSILLSLLFLKTSDVHAMTGISSEGSLRVQLSEDPALKNENALFLPASTSKVFTAITAVNVLGENFKYETPITWKVIDLHTISNVTVYGSGDPTWTITETNPQLSTPFKGFIEHLKKTGIRKIIGEIKFQSKNPERIDRRGSVDLNSKVEIPFGWDQPEKFGEYLRRDDGFGIIPSSFSYRLISKNGESLENAEWFFVEKFGCSGEIPTEDEKKYRLRFPHVFVDCKKSLVLDLELQKKNKNGSLTAASWNSNLQKYIYAGFKGDKNYLKSSIIPLTTKGSVIRLKEHLENILKQSQIELSPTEFSFLSVFNPVAEKGYFIIASEPLSDILKTFMKHSVNRLGESLVSQIGLKLMIEKNLTTKDAYKVGLDEIKRTSFLLAKKEGFNAFEGIKINDGCGLSRTSRVSPKFMTSVLAGILSSPALFSKFKKFAAISGESGTLESYRSKFYKGNIVGKTGTLNDAFNLVGFIKEIDQKNSNQPLVWVPFSIYSDENYARQYYVKKLMTAAADHPLSSPRAVRFAQKFIGSKEIPDSDDSLSFEEYLNEPLNSNDGIQSEFMFNLDST